MKKFLILFFLFLCSCSRTRYVYDFVEDDSYIGNKNYIISIGITVNSANAFILFIQNKTKNQIEIDWNKTLFIYNGATNGGFMFEGVNYSRRDEFKSPTIILAGQSLAKNIYPNILAGYIRIGKYGSWQNGTIPDGVTGVYLTMKVNGKEVNETLTIRKTTRIVEDK